MDVQLTEISGLEVAKWLNEAPRRYVPGLRPAARPFVQKRKRGLLGQAEPSLMHGGRTMEKYSESSVKKPVLR
jgi:hypothetical protein